MQLVDGPVPFSDDSPSVHCTLYTDHENNPAIPTWALEYSKICILYFSAEDDTHSKYTLCVRQPTEFMALCMHR